MIRYHIESQSQSISAKNVDYSQENKKENNDPRLSV